MNDDLEGLATITDKSRVRLFVNAGYMYKCPTKSATDRSRA
jgi:hypothetical protein